MGGRNEGWKGRVCMCVCVRGRTEWKRGEWRTDGNEKYSKFGKSQREWET